MPIVAHNALPTFERLRQEGQTILEPDRALHQTIRDLPFMEGVDQANPLGLDWVA